MFAQQHRVGKEKFFSSQSSPGVFPDKESTAENKKQNESCKVCFQTDEGSVPEAPLCLEGRN